MQFRNARPIATALKDSLRTNLSFANFDNDLQQDATELLETLLCVLGELLRVDGTDPISSLFCSPVISWIRCSNCGMYRDNVGDESAILHIPIIGTSIEESLRDGFFGIEQIDGWNCDNSECNSHGRKALLLETRDILILSLKRFPDHGTKDKTLVTFPLDDLDTTPFMCDNRQTTYKLAAVINHAGDSLARGHYTLSTRFSDNTWYRYDDENVNPITASEVVTKDVYTLVYCLSNKYNELITHQEVTYYADML
jgi:ubiquitin C-terminal hydrolase